VHLNTKGKVSVSYESLSFADILKRRSKSALHASKLSD